MKFFTTVFLFFALSSLYGQNMASRAFPFDDSTYVVANIYFVGNLTTKDYIIEREMGLKPGMLITHEQMQYDINRIYSLQLFNKVEMNITPQEGRNADVFVALRERWYFYPYPVIGIRDRSWDKLYYGLGVAHTNFQGKNVRIFSEFAAGYDPYVFIKFMDPMIDRDNNLFFSTEAYYNKKQNKSLVSQGVDPNFFEYRTFVNAGLGKRFSLYTSVSLSLEYLRISVTDNKAGRTISSTGTDKFFSAHLGFQFDTRDLREYPRLGSLVSFSLSKYGINHSEIDYQRFGFDLRRFVPIVDEVVGAARLFGNAAWGGRVQNYSHVFFGYGDRIRGHFKTILEGEQILGGIAEVHIPIIKHQYTRFEFIPIEQFRDVRYGINAALFADAGNVWYRTQPLMLKDFFAGYGAGIHFLFAYSAVLRLEYAIPYLGSFKNGEIIFDVGSAL